MVVFIIWKIAFQQLNFPSTKLGITSTLTQKESVIFWKIPCRTCLFFSGGLWCWVCFVHVLNKCKKMWLVTKETLKNLNLRSEPSLQADFCWVAGISHSEWLFRCQLRKSIFLAANLALVLTVMHNMAQCPFCYLQVLDNSHSDPTFLLVLAPSICSDLLHHSPFCTRMGRFELPLPMKSSSSLGWLVWHVPLLPAPPCPALSIPFPMNLWCSAASAALSQANHIVSSESAHQVFRKRLHFSVLAFKKYWSSGASLCNLHSSRFTVTFFSTCSQLEVHLGTTWRVSPQGTLFIHPICTAGNCFLTCITSHRCKNLLLGAKTVAKLNIADSIFCWLFCKGTDDVCV